MVGGEKVSDMARELSAGVHVVVGKDHDSYVAI